jgi:quinol monooxygenase YgiN
MENIDTTKGLPSVHNHTELSSANRWVFLILAVCVLVVFSFRSASAQSKDLVVRVAKLKIDSAQLETYKAMLKEGAETAVRVEPGVLTLYAVYEKEHPTHVTVFEIYANKAAYEAHLQTPHFKKYKNGTKDMVKSLELMEVSPIALATKPK